MKQINAAELKQCLDQGTSYMLLDVREIWEYEICAIPNSENIPMAMIPEALDKLNKDDPIVVICHHGMRSMNVAQFLEGNGFADITNLSGGIHAWAVEVDSEMEQY